MYNMKYKDVKIGEVYLFDPQNRMKQYESGVKFLQVWDKQRGFFSPSIIRGRSIRSDMTIGTGEVITTADFIEPFDPSKERLIIRFPENAPTFNGSDIAILSKLSNMAVNELKDQFSDPELVAVLSLLKKVEFYGKPDI